jgi:hypothetical protein
MSDETEYDEDEEVFPAEALKRVASALSDAARHFSDVRCAISRAREWLDYADDPDDKEARLAARLVREHLDEMKPLLNRAGSVIEHAPDTVPRAARARGSQ